MPTHVLEDKLSPISQCFLLLFKEFVGQCQQQLFNLMFKVLQASSVVAVGSFCTKSLQTEVRWCKVAKGQRHAQQCNQQRSPARSCCSFRSTGSCPT